MSKQEAPLEYLQRYLPANSVPLVMQYLHQYKVHLTITRERKSLYGDYRHATHDRNHRISVNGNLNTFSFLITLVHELAHLVTFQQYGNRVASHGKEWKQLFAFLLKDFLTANIFPEDIRVALAQSLHNLPASSCADDNLMRVLKRYDNASPDIVMVEQIPEGNLFALDDGRVFRRGKKLRKRYQCVEVKTRKLYLFSPVYEVKRTG
ncbi:MAG TPA: SprT-like domain-containing protein [Chitinophagaceae bacterium]|nr:SprT-like domain-containing protein [Chitinophagaceae bacterium]